MARKMPRNILKRWEYWKKQIQLWRQSGLSQAEFCRQNGLVTQQLSKWKKKLSGSPQPRSSVKNKKGQSRTTQSEPGRFIEVKLENSVMHSYQIRLTNGRSLYIPDNYDAQVISELITIMEQTC